MSAEKRRFVFEVKFMQLRAYILFLLAISIAFCSYGQNKGEYTQSRILILLDESSSMLQPWAGGGAKIKVANQLILKIMDSVYSVNGEVEFSLRVFGNQHTVPEHDCSDTRNEVPFSKYNKTQMEFRLEDLHPLGVTPIAFSLSEAAEKDLLDEKHNAYSIILITDGGESCGGDICEVMMKLIKNKVFFRPYILNLEDDPEVKKEYTCMGDYLVVTKKGDIPTAVGTIVNAFRPMLKMTKSEYKELRAINVPSPLKVNPLSIKPEKHIDSAETKKEIKPSVDTVAAVKPAPKHSIEIVEEKKRPETLKMKRITYQSKMKVFTYAGPPARSVAIDIQVPKLKVLEPEVLPVQTPPAKLTAMVPRGFKKIKTTKPELEAPQPIAIVVPTIKLMVPDVPPEHPAPAKLTFIQAKEYKKLKTTKPEISQPTAINIVVPDIKLMQPDVVAPPRPEPAKLTAIKTKGFKSIKIAKPELSAPPALTVAVPTIKLPEVPPPPPVVVKRDKAEVSRLKPSQFKMHLLYGGSFFDADLKPIKLPPMPQLKSLNTATTTATKPATATTTASKTPKTGEYTVEHEDAKETTLEVYLTNGKGKFYSTTPQVIILDPTTNKEIKKFYRFVDPSGNPDPITNLAAGKYDLTITGRDDLLAHVDLQPNKKNKVYIKVKNYSLYFYYIGNESRPVTEFSALVIQRNVANGKETVQKCTDRLEYEPGNYHIVISSFPEDIRNIDLDDNSAGGIGIEQPGFVKFTNDVKAASVILWKQTGERFISFRTISLSDPVSQHLQIQPGKYQVQYNNGTSNLSSSDRVIPFEIKSNKETEVTLKK